MLKRIIERSFLGIFLTIVLTYNANANQYSLAVNNGWNLISIPFITQEGNPKTFFNATKVCQYKPESGMTCDSGLSQLAPTNAYFVKYNSSSTFDFQTATSTAKPPDCKLLSSGWNLVEGPFANGITWDDSYIKIGTANLSTTTDIQKTVYILHSDGDESYIPIFYGQDIAAFNGFWVYANNSVQLCIDKPSEPILPATPSSEYLSYLPHNTGTILKYYWYSYINSEITFPIENMHLTADLPVTYPDYYDIYSVTDNIASGTLQLARFQADTQESSLHPGRRGTGTQILFPTSNGYYYEYESGDKGYMFNHNGLTQGPFLPFDVTREKKWVSSMDTYGNPAIAEILDTNLTMTVLAGSFSQCIKVFSKRQNQPSQLWMEEYFWFCKDKGLVKHITYVYSKGNYYNNIIELLQVTLP